MKLSDLKPNQTFKLTKTNNICIFLGVFLYDNQVRPIYKYKCVNSGNGLETYNNYEILT